MLIPLPEIIEKYNLNIKGVIQVGAHWAEENDVYIYLGIKNIVYIEPCKDAYVKMLHKVIPNSEELNFENDSYTWSVFNNSKYSTDNKRVVFHRKACADYAGTAQMKTANANQGQSNSLLNPVLHLSQHPEVVFNTVENVEVELLDNLIDEKEDYNLLVMDVQGAEGLVLKGATETLKHIDCIYTEVNRGQTYEGNMEIEEMDLFLADYAFTRVETYWPSPNLTWGDGIFLHKKYLTT
jgi:FkbM family methyltransferase